MKSWLGQYALNPRSESVEATVLALTGKLSIGYSLPDRPHTTADWPINRLEVSFDHSIQSTVIRQLNSNEIITIAGKDAMNYILEEQENEKKAWYKKPATAVWRRNLLLFFSITAFMVACYLLFVPMIAEKMARNVSIDTEEEFGNSIYDALNLSSKADLQATEFANDFFQKMKVNSPYRIRITVVNDDVVNAFALPGGHIVVYTGLLKKLDSYPELVALLAHEFTHVNQQHSTRSVFRAMGSRIFLSLIFGKMGTVTAILADQADNIKSLTYSRKLEKEADIMGLEIMKDRKIDPQGFVNLFERLRELPSKAALPEMLESHPDIETRIDYIKKASAGSEIMDNLELKSIFEEIKQLK